MGREVQLQEADGDGGRGSFDDGFGLAGLGEGAAGENEEFGIAAGDGEGGLGAETALSYTGDEDCGVCVSGLCGYGEADGRTCFAADFVGEGFGDFL